MTDLADAVAALTRRVTRLEDELAIHRLCIRYGFGADVGDGHAAAAVFTENGTYDVDVGRFEGRAAIAGMLHAPRHQSMVGHCAHQIGPMTVDFTSDTTATATGYSRVYLQTYAGTHVYRVSLNHWALEKHDGAWAIATRTTRMLGTPDALDVLRRASRPG